MLGLKPYKEKREVKDSLLDWKISDCIEYAKNRCGNDSKVCDNCILTDICNASVLDWTIKKESKLSQEEYEYLKQAHRFGFLWISSDSGIGTVLSFCFPEWKTTESKFFYPSGNVIKSEFPCGIGCGEYRLIEGLIEDYKIENKV